MQRRSSNKYNATRCEFGGYKFDSKKEVERFIVLREWEKLGKITGLKVHPKFTLLEGYTDNQGKRERAITYTADFAYMDGGRHVVEDVKGKATAKERSYVLRRKILKWRYKEIVFKEVIL